MPKFLAPATGITPPAADNSTNLATTSYVQGNLAAIPGANYKPTAAAATTGPLPACTYGNGAAGVGATLVGNAFGTLIVDGYTANPGEAILVKNQSIGIYNGLYTVTQIGDGASVFILTRHTAMDASADYVGAVVAVRNAGIVNAGTLWYCTNPAPPTVGASSIGFAALGAAPPDFGGSGASHAHGLVPDPGATAGTQKFLREDSSWIAPLINRTFCCGRITATSGDPVEVSGSGATLYFTPYVGNLIGLYDGSGQWNLLAFPETSVAVPGTSGVYDLFGYNSSGTLALETLAWTNTTTRATALATQDGIYVKSGATTRRYLGTFYSSSGTVSDTAVARNLWNYYHRIRKRLFVTETTDSSWTYGTNAFRVSDNHTSNSFTVVVGVKETATELKAISQGSTNGNDFATGIGYDSSSASIADIVGRVAVATIACSVGAETLHFTDPGLHTYYWLELVNPWVGGTVTLFSPLMLATTKTGMFGIISC